MGFSHSGAYKVRAVHDEPGRKGKETEGGKVDHEEGVKLLLVKTVRVEDRSTQ